MVCSLSSHTGFVQPPTYCHLYTQYYTINVWNMNSSLIHVVLSVVPDKGWNVGYCCTRQGVERIRQGWNVGYCCIRQGVELSQYSCVVGCLCNVPLDMIAFTGGLCTGGLCNTWDVTQLASSLSVHPPTLQV